MACPAGRHVFSRWMSEAPREAVGVAARAAPRPNVATARAMSGIRAALARKVISLLRVILLLALGSVLESLRPAVIESRNA